MKKIEDLKKDILDGKLEHFYVFYGEDYGIRKHYIDKIKTFFKSKPTYAESYEGIKFGSRSISLFGNKNQLVIVYDDEEFANLKEREIQTFINNLTTYTVIFVYEEALESSTLFKSFDQYITNFPVVQSNVALEFVTDEVKLYRPVAETIAKNCGNNYNNILMETGKIKDYAESKNVSFQNAYDTLDVKGQMIQKVDDFNAHEFMNDILKGNMQNIAYWYEVAKCNTDKVFMSLMSIFNDYLIAGILSRYGKWNGGTEAYNRCRLPWNRIKTIREFVLDADYESYFYRAYKVATIDAEVKSGKLARDDIIDYMINYVI